jgi:hypothetical protein
MPPEQLNLRGILSVTLYEQTDGSLLPNYGFLTMGPSDDFDTFYYYILEGDGLESLQKHNGLPVDVWGTLGLTSDGVPKINVERFEFPFPDLQYEILKGTEQTIDINGTSALLFTDENGNAYLELEQNCYDLRPADQMINPTGDPISAEVLPVPGLTSGGRPAICVTYSAPAVDPVTKQPIELTVGPNEPDILPAPPTLTEMPTLTIEKVELVYYVPNQRYLPLDPTRGPVYLQPAWRFYGHYSDGSIFEALIQALDPIFLLPELDVYTPPG